MQNSNFSFWSSFFGENQDNITSRFINNFNGYNTRIFGQKTAVWIDTGEAFKHYVEIPELRAVINKRAGMIASARPLLLNEAGEVVTDHWFNKVMENPNPTQSWADVIFSIGVNDGLYSNSFIYAPKRSFNIITLFLPLPSDRVEIVTTGRKLKQIEIEGLIKEYIFHYDDGDKETLNVKDVVYITSPDGMNIVKPVSRLEALKYPLSNIRASYHKRNVLLENIGSIGILSAKNSDIGGAIPLTPEEKKDIQNDWYRRSKDEIIITEADVTWSPMSYPTKDLLLFEELDADKIALIDAYGLNIYIFSQDKGATFTNVKEGVKMAYTDTIIPETVKIYDSITEQLGLDKDGLRLVPDFSHVAALQVDALAASTALKTRAEALEKINIAGVELTNEEKRALLDL